MKKKIIEHKNQYIHNIRDKSKTKHVFILLKDIT